MKLVIFTSNSIRHKFLANKLSKQADDTLVISEVPLENTKSKITPSNLIDEHFNLRNKTEQIFFEGYDTFQANTLTIPYKDASSELIFLKIKSFAPDLMIVFGSSVLKGKILSLLPSKFVNLHLGMSPYYRGSGTNFWPLVNNELEYLGSTILHIDEGIDTGDIICHVQPKIVLGDTVHTIGCKIIEKSIETLTQIIEMTKKKIVLPRTLQWDVNNSKYYKTSDFNENVLKTYYSNLENHMIEEFLKSKRNSIKTINLA